MAPVLILLAFNDRPVLFKWLLAVSFLTDAVDGYFSRRYKVSSVFGSRLDSVADDMTVVAAVAGLLVFEPAFVWQERVWLLVLLGLFLLQTISAFSRYRKLTSFHTYVAKIAAISQGVFFILFFFLPDPSYTVFYIAWGITALDLLEETILIWMLPRWEADVKGLYWLIRKKRQRVD